MIKIAVLGYGTVGQRRGGSYREEQGHGEQEGRQRTEH